MVRDIPALTLTERKALAGAELQPGGEPGASREAITGVLAQTRRICTCKPPLIPKSRRPRPKLPERSPRPRKNVIYLCSTTWPGGYREAPRGATAAPNEIIVARVPPTDLRCYPPRGPAVLDGSTAATFSEARRSAILGNRDPDRTTAEIGGLMRAAERGTLTPDVAGRRIAELLTPPTSAAQAARFRPAETTEERAARRLASTTMLLQRPPSSEALFRGTCGRTKLEWYCLTTPNGGFLGRPRGVAPPSRDWIRTGAIPEYTETILDGAGREQTLTHTEQGIKHPCCYPRDTSCDAGALGKWTTRPGQTFGPAAPAERMRLAPGVATLIPLLPTAEPAPPVARFPGDGADNPIFVTGLFERTYIGVDGLWYSVRGTL